MLNTNDKPLVIDYGMQTMLQKVNKWRNEQKNKQNNEFCCVNASVSKLRPSPNCGGCTLHKKQGGRVEKFHVVRLQAKYMFL